MSLNVSTNGHALLYVPNLSPNSYTPTENDGLPSWFIVGYVVWNWTSCWWCWADEKHDGNHSTRFLSKNINLSLWCSYGMFWFAGGGTLWATWPSNYGSYLATCFGFGIFATSLGHCEALEVDVVLLWYGMPWFMGWKLFLTFASFFWS